MVHILNLGTAPMLCILDVGTVRLLCILNIRTVLMFAPFFCLIMEVHDIFLKLLFIYIFANQKIYLQFKN